MVGFVSKLDAPRRGRYAFTMRELTDRQYRFAMAFVGEANGNASAAYRLAYDVENVSNNEISARASKVLQSPAISEFIAAQRKRVAAKFEIAALDVLRQWWEIATADPNEIIQAQRRCCRHCYGRGFQYQWRDAQEWAEESAKEMNDANLLKRPVQLVSDAGGFGFNQTLPPIVDCTMCRGDGNVQVIVNDTRKLTGGAKLLYAGVKTTRDGIEIKMRDQDAALANIAKAIGMFDGADAKAGVAFNFNFSGKASPAEATKLYKALLG